MRDVIALCLVTTLALGTGNALAADPTESTAEAHALTAKAGALYDEGVQLYKKGQWPDAHASFLAAWSIHKHWQIAANLASVELKLGKSRDAAEHAAYYLHNAPADRRARAQALFDKATAEVGTLKIRVNVQGADITLDGRSLGRAPLADDVFVEPGKHSVDARLDDYEAGHADLEVATGASKEIALTLVKRDAVPVSRGPSKMLIIPAAVLAAGGLAAGIGLTVAANGNASTASSLRAKMGSNSACAGAAASSPDCTTLTSNLQKRDSFTKGAFASFVIGSAFAVAATGLGVWAATASKDRKDTPAIRVVPTVGRGEGGVVLFGSF